MQVPPGFVGRGFADLAARALAATAGDDAHDLEVLVTSRVPVYGYGKSHGFTKLVRFAALPAALAAYDAALWASASLSDPKEVQGGGGTPDAWEADATVLRDALHGTEPGAGVPSADAIGTALMLMLRWHCRLSREFDSRRAADRTDSCFAVLGNPRRFRGSCCFCVFVLF